jgi:hypothetical protein
MQNARHRLASHLPTISSANAPRRKPRHASATAMPHNARSTNTADATNPTLPPEYAAATVGSVLRLPQASNRLHHATSIPRLIHV